MIRKIIYIALFCSCAALSSQTPVVIEGETYTNSDANWDGVEFPRNASYLVTFRNNSITSINTSSYMLLAGIDSYDARAHNVDNSTITGNRLDWNGTPGAQACHGIMAGYNLNYSIKYNYIDGPYYGIVHEGGYDDGESMVNTGGGISYNIFRNSPIMIYTMGQENVNIYNNTFYYGLTTSTNQFIRIGSSNGTDVPSPSKNVKIKNNIFYSRSDYAAININDAASLEGFECDYNVYYWASTAGNVPRFRINGTSYTWAQWQALGYDIHSVIVNPDFVDTINFAPSSRLNYGTSIVGYENGLTPSSDWIVDATPDVIQQDGEWQVGATILPVMGDYYVATWGNDANPGTFEQPWASLNYALNYDLQPGDTVYLRGGTYSVTTAQAITSNPGLVGEANNQIYFLAYPGETPIIDGAGKSTQSSGVTLYYSSYVYFKGITVSNHPQLVSGSFPSGWNLYYCTDLTFEQCVTHDIGGRGFAGRWCDRLTFINCDAYNLDNDLSASPGGDADGFFLSPSYHNFTGQHYFYGCRAWACSDDGWDIENLGLIVVENCWAFDNGFEKYDDLGLGNGLKLNLSPAEDVSQLSRTIINNITAYNRRTGITSNDNGNGARWMHVYNNTSYANGKYGEDGYGFQVYATTSSDANEEYRIYRNNIAYGNTTLDFRLASGAAYTHSNNSWDGGATITSADFAALPANYASGVAMLSGARQADGSLPDLGSYFKLTAGSDAIDAGVDVGLDYSGDAPDLGAYEYDADDIDSTATDILTFTLAEQTGAATINPTNHTVSIEVDYTADITSLTPTITLSYGATIDPTSGTSRDFTSPVTYTVTALDETTTQEWVVTVTQEAAPEEPAGDSSIVKVRGLILKL